MHNWQDDMTTAKMKPSKQKDQKENIPKIQGLKINCFHKSNINGGPKCQESCNSTGTLCL